MHRVSPDGAVAKARSGRPRFLFGLVVGFVLGVAGTVALGFRYRRREDYGPIGGGRPVRLRFFHDYTATPLWTRRGELVGLERLPLSHDLRRRLTDWSREVDRVLMPNFYEWPDEATRGRLEQLGQSLCQEVQRELGPEYEVECEIF